MRKISLVILTTLLFITICSVGNLESLEAQAAPFGSETACTWTAGGDGTSWEDHGNWSGCDNIYPQNNSHSVTICNASQAVDVTITATTTLTIGKLVIGESGGDTDSCNGKTHELDLQGDLTIDDGNAFANAGDITIGHRGEVTANSSTITIDGDWDSSGSGTGNPVFTGGTSHVSFIKTGTIDITSGEKFYNLTIGASGETTTLLANTNFTNVVTIDGGTVAESGGDYWLSGTKTSGAPFVANANSVFNTITLRLIAWNSQSGDLTIPGGVYGGLVYNSGNNYSLLLTASTTVKGTTEISHPNTRQSIFDTNGFDFTTGDLQIGASGFYYGIVHITGDSTVLVESDVTDTGDALDAFEIFNGNTMTVKGDFIPYRTDVEMGTSTIVFAGSSGNQSVNTDGTVEFHNVTINNTSTAGTDKVIFSDNLDVDNNLVLTDGVLDLDTNTKTLAVGGNLTINNTADPNIDRDTVSSMPITFDGTTTYTDNLGSIDLGEIVIASSTASATFTLASNATTSAVTIATGEELDLGSNTIYFYDSTGSTTPLNIKGTFTPNTGTVSYKATSTSVTIPVLTYFGIEFNDEGNGNTFTLTDQLNASSSVTIANGTLDSDGNNIVLDGNWSNSGTFTHNSNTTKFTGTSGTINVTGGSSPFNVLTFDDSGGAAIFELQDRINASSTLTITDGRLDANDQTIVLDGDLTNADTFTSGVGTTTFSGASNQTLTSNASTLCNIVVDKSNSLLLGDDLEIKTPASGSCSLNIDGGTFDMNDKNLKLNVLIYGVLDFTVNQGGTFTKGTEGSSSIGVTGIAGLASPGVTLTDNTGAQNFGDIWVGPQGLWAQLKLGSDATTTSMYVSMKATGGFRWANYLDISGYKLTVANTTATTSLNIATDSVLTTDSNSSVELKGTVATTVDDLTFQDLIINSSGIAFTPSSNIDVNGALNVVAGTLRLGGTADIEGDISNTDTIIETATNYIIKSSSLAFDASSYNAEDGDTMTITLTDHDENLVGTTTDSNIVLTLSMATGADTENVTLTESGVATGVFTGTLSLAKSNGGNFTKNNGTLEVSADTTITTSYTDSEDSTDTSTATVTVTEDTATTEDTSTTGGGGIVGIMAPITIYAPPPTTPPPTTPTPSLPTITQTFSPGVTNTQVITLQQFLNSQGFTLATTGPGSPGNETTFFGTLTRTALQKFQCHHGIVCEGTPQTTGYGRLGPKTKAKINELNNSPQTQQTQTQQIQELQELIRELQEKLRQLQN